MESSNVKIAIFSIICSLIATF